MTQKVPIIDIEADVPIQVALLGDMHYGHKKCNYKALKMFREWLRLPNHYWIGMGDYIENSAPRSSPPGAMWEQELPPEEQYYWFEDFWQRTVPLWLLEGNHEWRTPKVTSLDMTQRLATHLNCLYLEEGRYAIIRINKKINYVFYTAHGYGSSATKGYHLRKLIEQVGVDDADVVGIGHIHQLHHESFIRKRIRRGYEVWHEMHGVRTGGFLDTPKYAAVRLYRWARVGAPIVTLGHLSKNVQVDITTRVPEVE